MIDLQNIGRNFNVGDQVVHALDQVNLKIDEGEYVSIMGPSGSGKSTLLNVLGLLDRPTQGHYLLNGTDITRYSDDQLADTRQHNIGFIFQFFQLLPRLTAQENIELPLTLAGVEVSERHQRSTQAMQSLGISERANHRPDQLSGGQQQRVAIARAMVMRARIILADEPTGNLDRHSSAEVVAILESLNEQGMMLVVVTHDSEIGSRARRKIKMVDGQIVEDNV